MTPSTTIITGSMREISDGARIVDPIIAGINSGEHLWENFLKDYRPTDW